MSKIGVFGLLLLALCRAQTPAAKTSLEGHVTNIAGEPLKNATVQLQMQVRLTAPQPPGQRPASPPFYTATSDASGNFAFEGVDSARYSLAVQRTGYLKQNYASEIDLTRGQPAAGIAIKLTPEGQIDGKVTDEDGEPVLNARLMLYRWAVGHAGLKQLQNVSVGTAVSANVAADGSFVIGGLTAGHYYVSATVDLFRRDSKEAYLPVFYPNVSDVANATQVQVSAGSIARGIDIQVSKSRVYHVRGHSIVATTGAPAAGMEIAPYREDPGRATGAVSSATVKEDGTFDLGNVAPGPYVLRTVRVDRNNPNQPQTLFSSQSVTVTNEDVEGVVVRLNPGVEITGKVYMEDNSPLL
jgi:5-hydroxyisourate hydrolase-like protein (transthyretin family)